MRVPHQLLRETLAIEAYAGVGSRGPTFASTATFRASVQPSTRLIVGGDGRTIGDLLECVIRPEVAVPVESRVTWQGQRYRVIQSNAMPDTVRPSHRELILSRTA